MFVPIRPYLVRLDELTDLLEETENKRQKVLEFMHNAPFLCFIKNGATGNYEYVNTAYTQLVGKKEQEIIGKTAWELHPLKVAQKMIDDDVKLLKEQKDLLTIDVLHSAVDNKNKPFLTSKFIVRNGDISIGGIALMLPDEFDFASLIGFVKEQL